MVRLSVLDLVPVTAGSTPGDALRNSLELARHAERLGYQRYWVAEHHNMTGDRQRGDLGRHRLPRRRHLDDPRRCRRHHAAQPLAAGDRRAVRHARIALPRAHRPRPRARARHRPAGGARPAPRSGPRRQLPAGRHASCRPSSRPRSRASRSQAVPGAGSEVPLWILGSSLFGAQLAAAAGPAVRVRLALRARRADGRRSQIYRADFQPSDAARRSRTRWSALNVVAADTDAEARRLFTSSSRRSPTCGAARRGRMPPPIDDIDAYWTPTEQIQASQHAEVRRGRLARDRAARASRAHRD